MIHFYNCQQRSFFKPQRLVGNNTAPKKNEGPKNIDDIQNKIEQVDANDVIPQNPDDFASKINQELDRWSNLEQKFLAKIPGYEDQNVRKNIFKTAHDKVNDFLVLAIEEHDKFQKNQSSEQNEITLKEKLNEASDELLIRLRKKFQRFEVENQQKEQEESEKELTDIFKNVDIQKFVPKPNELPKIGDGEDLDIDLENPSKTLNQVQKEFSEIRKMQDVFSTTINMQKVLPDFQKLFENEEGKKGLLAVAQEKAKNANLWQWGKNFLYDLPEAEEAKNKYNELRSQVSAENQKKIVEVNKKIGKRIDLLKSGTDVMVTHSSQEKTKTARAVIAFKEKLDGFKNGSNKNIRSVLEIENSYENSKKAQKEKYEKKIATQEQHIQNYKKQKEALRLKKERANKQWEQGATVSQNIQARKGDYENIIAKLEIKKKAAAGNSKMVESINNRIQALSEQLGTMDMALNHIYANRQAKDLEKKVLTDMEYSLDDKTIQLEDDLIKIYDRYEESLTKIDEKKQAELSQRSEFFDQQQSLESVYESIQGVDSHLEYTNRSFQKTKEFVHETASDMATQNNALIMAAESMREALEQTNINDMTRVKLFSSTYNTLNMIPIIGDNSFGYKWPGNGVSIFGAIGYLRDGISWTVSEAVNLIPKTTKLIFSGEWDSNYSLTKELDAYVESSLKSGGALESIGSYLGPIGSTVGGGLDVVVNGLFKFSTGFVQGIDSMTDHPFETLDNISSLITSIPRGMLEAGRVMVRDIGDEKNDVFDAEPWEAFSEGFEKPWQLFSAMAQLDQFSIAFGYGDAENQNVSGEERGRRFGYAVTRVAADITSFLATGGGAGVSQTVSKASVYAKNLLNIADDAGRFKKFMGAAITPLMYPVAFGNNILKFSVRTVKNGMNFLKSLKSPIDAMKNMVQKTREVSNKTRQDKGLGQKSDRTEWFTKDKAPKGAEGSKKGKKNGTENTSQETKAKEKLRSDLFESLDGLKELKDLLSGGGKKVIDFSSKFERPSNFAKNTIGVIQDGVYAVLNTLLASVDFASDIARMVKHPKITFKNIVGGSTLVGDLMPQVIDRLNKLDEESLNKVLSSKEYFKKIVQEELTIHIQKIDAATDKTQKEIENERKKWLNPRDSSYEDAKQLREYRNSNEYKDAKDGYVSGNMSEIASQLKNFVAADVGKEKGGGFWDRENFSFQDVATDPKMDDVAENIALLRVMKENGERLKIIKDNNAYKAILFYDESTDRFSSFSLKNISAAQSIKITEPGDWNPKNQTLLIDGQKYTISIGSRIAYTNTSNSKVLSQGLVLTKDKEYDKKPIGEIIDSTIEKKLSQ